MVALPFFLTLFASLLLVSFIIQVVYDKNGK
jgi:hypothetical protein